MVVTGSAEDVPGLREHVVNLIFGELDQATVAVLLRVAVDALDDLRRAVGDGLLLQIAQRAAHKHEGFGIAVVLGARRVAAAEVWVRHPAGAFCLADGVLDAAHGAVERQRDLGHVAFRHLLLVAHHELELPGREHEMELQHAQLGLRLCVDTAAEGHLAGPALAFG